MKATETKRHQVKLQCVEGNFSNKDKLPTETPSVKMVLLKSFFSPNITIPCNKLKFLTPYWTAII